MTPAAGSGISTPFNSQSRSGSAENLASMNSLGSSILSAAALHNHLINMPSPGHGRLAQDRAGNSGPNTPACGSYDIATEENLTHHRRELSARNEYFTSLVGNSNPPGHIRPLPQRGSEEHHTTPATYTSQHIELSAEDLSKVPSYGTALQTPAGTPYSEKLPTYQIATSRPPTPPPLTPQNPNPTCISQTTLEHSHQPVSYSTRPS